LERWGFDLNPSGISEIFDVKMKNTGSLTYYSDDNDLIAEAEILQQELERLAIAQ